MSTGAAAVRTIDQTTALEQGADGVSDPLHPEAGTVPASVLLENPEHSEVPTAPTAPANPRDAIAARFRARREQEDASFKADIGNGTDEQFVPAIAQPRQEPEPAANRQPAPANPDAPRPAAAAPAPASNTYRLKVRGQDLTVNNRADLIRLAEFDDPSEAEGLPDTQLIKLAQKNLATNSYLEESRNQAKEARFAARAPGADTPAPQEQQPAPQPQQDPWEVAAHELQYGEPETAAQALRNAHAAERGREDAVRHRQSLSQDVTTALGEYSAQNSDLIAHEAGSRLLLSLATEEILKDLEGLGVPRDRLDPLLTNPTMATAAYTDARAAGLKVRTPAQILEDAGTKVRRIVGLQQQPQLAPAPALTRQERKQGLPTQPARAGNAPQPALNPTPTKSRSDAVAEMKNRFRGPNVPAQ